MSPEQCEGAKAADQGSDVYSLGIILFELLTGRTPFREPGEGVGVILSRQMFMPASAPSTMVSGRSIPPEVDAVVLKALAKNPKDRYLLCFDFYDALVKAVGPLASETFASIKGAKPIYHSEASSSEPLSKLVSEELAKKTPTHDAVAKSVSASRTGDFYSGSKEPTIGAPTSAPVKKSRGLFAAIGVAMAVALGLVFFGGGSSPKGEGVTPAKTQGVVSETKQVVTPLAAPEAKVTTPETPASVPTTQPSATTPKTEDKKPANKKVLTAAGDKKTEPTEQKPETTEKKPKDDKKETPAGPALIFDGE